LCPSPNIRKRLVGQGEMRNGLLGVEKCTKIYVKIALMIVNSTKYPELLLLLSGYYTNLDWVSVHLLMISCMHHICIYEGP
jgi:hypothetical protein